MLRRHSAPAESPRERSGSRPVVGDAELFRAVERDEFVLHYQPQIDIASGTVVGLEALVRWHHPERGLIYPDHFIARIEALGLIDELGWIVADRSMAELTRFADVNGVLPMLSMNVSASSLHDLRFPDTMAALIARHGVSPAKIVLEITESGLIKELTRTLEVLTRLRMRDVQLSIDDFGGGYSMMQQLRNIPATELKIDKSFVHNMHGTDSDRVIVQKTIEIGHELGMKVIAEGVETLQQLAFLRVNGCDLAQGYLFSRPLAPDEMTVWLDKFRLRQST